MDMQNTVPLQIEPQQPVWFTDALRRVMPIHLELVDSTEAAFNQQVSRNGLEVQYVDDSLDLSEFVGLSILFVLTIRYLSIGDLVPSPISKLRDCQPVGPSRNSNSSPSSH